MSTGKITWLWTNLQRVNRVQFSAKSRSKTGWSGTGIGVVVAEVPDSNTILFHESGNWQSEGQKDLTFRNVFRWHRLEDRIRLEHLRFGANHPVYLFDLASDTDDPEPDARLGWTSVAPHLCREDEYTARLEHDYHWEYIYLTWKIRGPEKDEEIAYVYF